MKRRNNPYRARRTAHYAHGLARATRGFTLIEILIVSVLLAFVSMAIYAVLNNGLKIYKRVNQEVPQEELAIFFDKFAYDLRNTFAFSRLTFRGEDDGLELAALVNSPALQTVTPGKVGYFFDRDERVIYREQKDASQLYTREQGRAVAVLHNVEDARFTYYHYDKERKEYVWENSWVREELPRAVRIEMQWDDGSRVNEFRRTVSISVSN